MKPPTTVRSHHGQSIGEVHLSARLRTRGYDTLCGKWLKQAYEYTPDSSHGDTICRDCIRRLDPTEYAVSVWAKEFNARAAEATLREPPAWVTVTPDSEDA